jgi:hypothetical protein
MESLPREKNRSEEKKKTWNKKTKRVLVKRSGSVLRMKIKSYLPGGGALRAIYKKCGAMILSK